MKDAVSKATKFVNFLVYVTHHANLYFDLETSRLSKSHWKPAGNLRGNRGYFPRDNTQIPDPIAISHRTDEVLREESVTTWDLGKYQHKLKR